MDEEKTGKKGNGFHGKGKPSRDWKHQVFSDLHKFHYLFESRTNEIPVPKKEQNT